MPGRSLAELRLSVLDAIAAELLQPYSALLLAALVLTAAVARGESAEERRRVRIITLFFSGHVALAGVAGALRVLGSESADVIHYLSLGLATLAGVGMATAVLWVVLVQKLGLPLPPIVRDLAGAVATAVALIAIAGRAGINVAGLVATSAVLTAVVGLSLQDTLGNLVAGLTLQSDTSLHVGDWIRVGEIEGRVTEMRWRFTSIETRNGETLIIPNAGLVKDKVFVLGRRQGKPVAWRRWIRFDVDYRVAHARVIEVVSGAFRGGPLPRGVSAEPPVDVVVTNFKPGAVEYALRYWLTALEADAPVDSSVRERITSALARAGLTHAYPLERRMMLDESAQLRLIHEEDLAARRAAIHNIEILRVLEPSEQAVLAERLRPAPYERGEVLFRQGDAPDSLYVIASGKVSVKLKGGDGEEHEIAELGPGDVLGEMGLMTGERRTATAQASTHAEVYRLGREAFDALIKQRPAIAEALAQVLAARQQAQAAAKTRLDGTSQPPPPMDSSAFLERIRGFFGLG